MDTTDQEFNSAVAAILRGYRGQERVTIDQLAERAGMVRGTLLRYLNGQRDIPIPALRAISTALGVDPGRVLDEAEDFMQRQNR